MQRRLVSLVGALLVGAPIAAHAQSLPVWQNGMVKPNGDAGMLMMGEKGGFAKAMGLDLKTVPLRGDPIVLKALVAGQIDSYIGGPASPLVAASKGADIKIIGCGWLKQSYVLWGGKDVTTVEGLRGKAIAISTPGSAPDIFARAALQASGVSPSDVKFVPGGLPPDWLKSMAAGIVQGSATPDEYAARGESLGLHVLTTSDKATPLSMQRCYFTRSATLKAHPKEVADFLAAEMAAYTYSLSHREQTIKLTEAIINTPDAAQEATTNYDSIVKRNVIDTSFEPPMDKLLWLRDTLAGDGLLDAKWDPASMIDLGPLQDARKLYQASGAKAAEGAPAALAAAGVK